MPTYIQQKHPRRDGLRTVAEYRTRKDARAALAEHAAQDSTALYYLSSRPCDDWRHAPADIDKAKGE